MLPEWFYTVSAVTIIVGGLVDIWLVNTGRWSISLTVWLEEKSHPIIIAGVLLLGVWIASETYSSFWLTVFVLLATGHFVTSEGAAVLVNTKRWAQYPWNAARAA